MNSDLRHFDTRSPELRRVLKILFRAAIALLLSGLLLGATVQEGAPPTMRAYLAAILAIAGIALGGATVIIQFILNASQARKNLSSLRSRERPETPPNDLQ